jgi:hypothetical protein
VGRYRCDNLYRVGRRANIVAQSLHSRRTIDIGYYDMMGMRG